jgi:hypothetical protein
MRAGLFFMNFAEKYAKERQRLETNRSLDWSSFAREYIAAGESLQPMTVQVWFDLLVAKSPLLVGGDITVESVVDYVWRNCKRRTGSKLLKAWRLFWVQHRIEKALNKDESAESLMQVIFEHIKESFDEYPDSLSASTKKSNAMSGAAGETQMLDEIAHRYGIDPREVLTMSLRRAFALQRTIRLATIDDYKLLEPESLRTIKSQFLNQKNGQQ